MEEHAKIKTSGLDDVWLRHYAIVIKKKSVEVNYIFLSKHNQIGMLRGGVDNYIFRVVHCYFCALGCTCKWYMGDMLIPPAKWKARLVLEPRAKI